MKNIILSILIILSSFFSYCQETYTIGKTEYYYNQYYATTGKPIVKRSESNKKEFLKSKGYTEIPSGYQIDHIIPLSEGGTDEPSNMQLLTIDQHKEKTARERSNRGNSTHTSTYNFSSYSNKNNSIPSNNPPTTTSSREIQTGPRGGKYYINSNGNKTYIK